MTDIGDPYNWPAPTPITHWRSPLVGVGWMTQIECHNRCGWHVKHDRDDSPIRQADADVITINLQRAYRKHWWMEHAVNTDS